MLGRGLTLEPFVQWLISRYKNRLAYPPIGSVGRTRVEARFLATPSEL